MNNSSLNRFAYAAADIDMGRSKFDRPFRHLTTMDAGKLIPIYWDEVLPGDTLSMDVGSLVRMATPMYPVMDNAYLDIHAYFVPNRLLWEHWEEFLGANKTTYWTQPTTYVPPRVSIGSTYTMTDTIVDYFGLPVQVGQFGLHTIEVSALPYRAYALIWNEWYRDENLLQPCNVSLGDTAVPVAAGNANTSLTYEQYISTGAYVTRGQFGDQPLPVCKFHDYFTSALPSAEKGSPVGVSMGGLLPVVTQSEYYGWYPGNHTYTNAELRPFRVFDRDQSWSDSSRRQIVLDKSDRADATHPYNGLNRAYRANVADAWTGEIPSGYADLYLDREIVDLSQASAITINALREAFAVQRFLEKAARGGTRYTEILQSFFGVTSSDASLQRPQYLGGKRIPINMTQVAQTSAGAGALGDLAAFSQTIDGSALFTKSFEEHGILMVMAMIRTDRSYQQGIAKKWSRIQMTDYYFPVFANLGEQPVYTKELYWDGTNTNTVFGYQEAWAEYRYSPSIVSGKMRSTGTPGFDMWHYADYYTSAPTLTSSWIIEPQGNLDRTLAVKNGAQFIAEFAFSNTWVRPMPVYSIPGLIDHH